MKLDFKPYELLNRAIEEGLELGWKRAHKYDIAPTKDIVIENMMQCIMDSIEEIIKLDK